MIFFIAQLIGLVAWIFFLFSYFGKNVNKVVLYQLISSVFYCLNYFLLGATTGFFISLFEAIRELINYKTDKDYYVFFLTLPIYIFIVILSSKTILLVIPIIASLIDGYSVLKNKKVIVIGGVISNFLWIIYDLYYLDYIVAFADLILVLANISILCYDYSKFLNRDNVYVTSGRNISMDNLKTIWKLDNEYYDSKYCWSLDLLKELYNKEKSSYILIKDGGKIIGYVNVLNLKKEVYDSIFNSEDIYDNFKLEDIMKYHQKNIKYYLNLNSIVLKNEYQNTDTEEKIVNGIKKYLKNKRKEGYDIEEIRSYAVNDYEKLILEKLGFQKEKIINNECILYCLKMS